MSKREMLQTDNILTRIISFENFIAFQHETLCMQLAHWSASFSTRGTPNKIFLFSAYFFGCTFYQFFGKLFAENTQHCLVAKDPILVKKLVTKKKFPNEKCARNKFKIDINQHLLTLLHNVPTTNCWRISKWRSTRSRQSKVMKRPKTAPKIRQCSTSLSRTHSSDNVSWRHTHRYQNKLKRQLRVLTCQVYCCSFVDDFGILHFQAA